MTKPMTADMKEERIRMRAYEIWCEEGQPQGRDMENWLKACDEIEADLRKAAGLAPKKPAAAKPAASSAKPKVTKAAKSASAVLHS
jgi:hypothetical protein